MFYKTVSTFSILLLACVGSARANSPVVEAPPELAEGRTIVRIYDESVATLERICDDYRRIKALELMRIRDLAFEDAYAFVHSVMPVLKPIDRDILRRRITDPSEIEAHKHAVVRVESEIANMVELAARLLSEIEEYKHKIHQEIPEDSERKLRELADILNDPDYDPDLELAEARTLESDAMTELQELAKEKPEERAVDLTEAMRKLAKETAEAQEEVLEPPVVENHVTPADVLRESGQLSLVHSDVGRRVVSEGGSAVEWMWVDTWYTIGPFPNPQRINLNTKFPPETVLDLSATYPGKGGRNVSWKFLQTNRLKCVPHDDVEYAIYYAYTEVWMDTATDLWVAIGSDDKANVWVNNLPIWISGDELKSWRANEGLRKVRFEAGVNRILFRIENGWKETAFSLAIQVKH